MRDTRTLLVAGFILIIYVLIQPKMLNTAQKAPQPPQKEPVIASSEVGTMLDGIEKDLNNVVRGTERDLQIAGESALAITIALQADPATHGSGVSTRLLEKKEGGEGGFTAVLSIDNPRVHFKNPRQHTLRVKKERAERFFGTVKPGDQVLINLESSGSRDSATIASDFLYLEPVTK